ncbi:MocR-like pyridoxine biosynthesis transcription factor PdxR [Mycobacterium deserti]|uniref:PLP-dependent aminotransferase family protein n=1 Tax=Mycobacterium deserti TaxID=2978347 RepID=A0ABT2MAS7_9MYCO|nr:PLP-dependent aminotransferase family protein [Mycobacterium deserti]MCT7658096.1 PLP-dependent aminotransferase family protein [Mycobacterium deserti]
MDQAGPTPRGADFLLLDPATAPARGLTDWLATALRSAIDDGLLAPGSRIPATRVLATELGVSRGVVVEAYRRLSGEGLVGGRTGGGTTVLIQPARAEGPRPQPARQGPPRLPRPRLGTGIDLSPGVPDLSAFPRGLWLRTERAVLTETPPEQLGYGDPRGHPRLRTALAPWLARTRGLRAGPDDIIVVSGVAQAMALLAQQLCRDGVDSIAVEDPGSRGAVNELGFWGLRPVPVPVDDDGIRVDALAASGARAAFLTPAHQFPTGVVLAPHRRRELLAWAMMDAELVIEDDYDAEYRYDRAPVPALHAAAPERIAYAGSTSKSLAPALRLGWLVAPPQRYEDLVAAKHASDLGSPTVPQLVLARLLESGEYDRHVRLVRTRHRARRDALLSGLSEALPAVTVKGVAAGLHLLITLPDGSVDDVALAEELQEASVLVHPLSWHRRLPGPPGLVLGYAAHSPDSLRAAAATIGQVVTSRLS